MPTKMRKVKEKNNIISVHFDALFFFERGVRSFNRHNLVKALKYFERCVAIEPTNAKYYIHLSAALTELEQYEKSNELLYKVIHELDQSMSDCHYYLANNYAHMGELEEAEHHVLTYLQNEPEGMYIDEAEELLDYICLELERSPKQLTEERELIEKHDQARQSLEKGKFVEASQKLELMIEQFPHFLAARNNLALAYYYQGEYKKALQVIGDILERDEGNLHALCNLAIFYSHKKEEMQKLSIIIDGLKKIQPLQLDHHYKLATTLGILGEDERAYELFMQLVKRGHQDDYSLYHYVAVAAFNTGRLDTARYYWTKVKQLDSDEQVATYYLELLQNPHIFNNERRLPYHYQLPCDIKLHQSNWQEDEQMREKLANDPLVRSSLFWFLKHGDQDTKLQVIQSLQFFADKEAEEALRSLLLEKNEKDYVKQMAIFVLRQMGALPPYKAEMNGQMIEIDEQMIDRTFLEWSLHWQKVIHCLQQHMDDQFDILDYQEAQILWSKFLRLSYPHLPKIRKPEAWAAAIESLFVKKNGSSLTKKQIASKYGISISTLSRNLHCLEESINLDT